ncbi:MAG: hypothetical protein VX519_02580 [Myxococcota bacterium]|nr:hypothetical protein [Myxococcota bacterium]
MPWVQDSHGALAEIRLKLRELRDALEEGETLLGGLLAPTPVTEDSTVHEVWARHPGVRELFARHHLHGCDVCPVGADETLAEMAYGHRIDLEDFLQSLKDLLE